MIYQQKPKHNHAYTLAGIAFVFVVGFVTYHYFSARQVSAVDAPLVSSDAPTDTSASPLTPEQMALLDKIRDLKINGDLFKDQLFLNLTDWSVKLDPQEVGKPNPFLPFPKSSSKSSATASR
jgi:hypothetical protein